MSLPPHVAALIQAHLGHIKDCFLDAKVTLVIDNGEPEMSAFIGDGDPHKAMDLIRHFHDLADPYAEIAELYLENQRLRAEKADLAAQLEQVHVWHEEAKQTIHQMVFGQISQGQAEPMDQLGECEILGYRLVLTCSACPEQYDVFKDHEQVAYFRLRHGHFRVHVPDAGGDTIYEARPNGDGIFEHDERRLYLTEAVAAVDLYRKMGGGDG